MKTQLLIGTALLAAVSAFSQTAGQKLKPIGIVHIKTIAEYKYGAQESNPITAKPTAVLSQYAQKTSATTSNTWQNFTASMNIYGVSSSYVKPLQWNDDLNAVSFIHRKSPTYISSPAASQNAENGTIVTMISTDCGVHWDSTAMWVNSNFWARFPGGAIYNPPANTNINNAYMVGAGPATGGGNVTWIANWYASKKIGTGTYDNMPSTVANATQIAVTAGTPLPNVARHDFSGYGFTATDDGKMRVLAGITDDALIPASDTSVMLVTGTFNNGVFDWAGKSFWMPVTKNSLDGSFNFVPLPMMAWNETGTIGYIVVMGSRIGSTGSNVGYQPIVYKTLNNGQTWALESAIVDFNTPAYADILRPLFGVSADTTIKVPNFYWGEGMDCAVDANNKLHIFTSIIGHPSNDTDSLNFISQFTSEKYLWAHQPGLRPYLYDFTYDGTNTTPAWSHMLLDSMSSESISAKAAGAGYEDNPWDKDPGKQNDKFRVDARLQMSRTPDGKHLLYTWAESDTAFTDGQRAWNSQPNIKARILDVEQDTLIDDELSITGDAIGEINGRAMCHHLSPKFKLVSKTNTKIIIEVPVTVSNSTPYSQLSGNSHWYSCASLEFARPIGVSIAENTSADANNSYIYPNPANTSVAVSINLAKASAVHIDVINAMGQIVKTSLSGGQSGRNTISVDLAGLSSGIYFVRINADNTSSTKKLIIE